MASGDAWNAGWNLGTQIAQEKYAHKQALSDMELNAQWNQHQKNIDALQGKLPALLKTDDKGQTIKTPEYLKASYELEQAIQARNSLLHPDKKQGPGVLRKFGKLLRLPEKPAPIAVNAPVFAQSTMDADGEKVPTGAPFRVQGPQTPAQLRAQAEARQLEAAAPLTPEQEAQQQARGQTTLQTALSNQKIQWLKDHGASQDVIDEAIAMEGGVPVAKMPRPVGVPYLDKDTGKYYQRYLQGDGTETRVEEQGYTPPGPKPSSGVEASLIRALYGDNPTAEQMKAGISEYKELNTPVKTSATQVLIYDQDNHPHVFEKVTTNRSTFGGARTGTTGGAPAAPAAGASRAAAPGGPINKSKNPEDQPKAISFAFNQPWSKPGASPQAPYSTILLPGEEREFRQWAAANPNAVRGEVGPGPDFAPLPDADYDVRGHFHASKTGDPAAQLTMNAKDGKMHGSDKFKTPYDGTFSNESIYATPDAPHWEGDKLVTGDGRLVYDSTPTAADLRRNAQARRAGQGAGAPAAGATPRAATPASAPRAAAAPAKTAAATSKSPIGPALPFTKASPQSTLAKKNLDVAYNAYLDVSRASPDGGITLDPVSSQGIMLAWLRGRVNRVTATEIQAIRNLGGITARFDGRVESLLEGRMTPQQYQWFLQSAQRNYEDAQTIANQYGGEQAPSEPGKFSAADLEKLIEEHSAGPQ